MIKKISALFVVASLGAAVLLTAAFAAVTLGDSLKAITYDGNDPQAFGEFSPATVTTNEADLDAIYSQASFGASTVDIRYNAIKTLTDASLLTVTTPAGLNALLNNAIGDASPTVNMYFIDTLDECSGFNPAIVGCAHFPGHNLVVESAFAAGVDGPEVQGHELGHNLSLPHVVPANLMTGTINQNTTLDAGQVTTILLSALIQTDGGGQRFISITPILVQAPIPEPTVTALFGLAGILLIGRRRR